MVSWGQSNLSREGVDVPITQAAWETNKGLDTQPERARSSGHQSTSQPQEKPIHFSTSHPICPRCILSLPHLDPAPWLIRDVPPTMQVFTAEKIRSLNKTKTTDKNPHSSWKQLPIVYSTYHRVMELRDCVVKTCCRWWSNECEHV